MTGLEIVTLVVAILGVVLAVASLVWQAATFVLSGSRVGLTLRRGLIRRDGAGTVALALGPLEPSADRYAMLREQGFSEEVVIVEVRNRALVRPMTSTAGRRRKGLTGPPSQKH